MDAGPSAEGTNLGKVGELLKKKNQNGEKADDLSKRKRPKKDTMVIIHYSEFKTSWDWAVLTLTYYTSVVVPLVAAFNVTGRGNLWLMVDSMVDVFFFADVIINFHTTYAGEEGEIISDLKLIRIKYLKTWFFADIMTCVPYDGINLLFGEIESFAHLLGIMKAFRLLRLFRIARDLDRYLAHAYASLIVLMSLILLLCHWMGCGWYRIALLDATNHVKSLHDASQLVRPTQPNKPLEKNFINPFQLKDGSNDIFFESKMLPDTSSGHKRRDVQEDDPVMEEKTTNQIPVKIFQKNWLVRLGERTGDVFFWDNKTGLQGGPRLDKAYCSCLYFTMTAVISQGFGNLYGETHNEQLYCIFILLLGCLLYAAILGNVTTAMEAISARKEQFNEIIHSIKKFSKLHSVPKHLVDSMFDYVYFTWTATHGISERKVLDCIPEHMRLDASVYLHRHVMTTQNAFKSLTETSSRHLASKMERCHIAPGDLLIDRGEAIEMIYIVVSGSLEIVLDGQIVGILSSADTFGTEFWSSAAKRKGGVTSEFSVVALTYVNLEVICGPEVVAAMKVYPDIQKAFFRSFKLTFDLSKKMDFKTVAAVQWLKEVEENPDTAKKDRRLKTWLTKTRRTHEDSAPTAERKEEKPRAVPGPVKLIKKVMSATKLIPKKKKAAIVPEAVPEKTERPNNFLRKQENRGQKTDVGMRPEIPKRYQSAQGDVVELMPLHPNGEYFEKLSGNTVEQFPEIVDDVIVRASVYEISYDNSGKKTVRQLPDINFSLERGDWIDSELPIELKEILLSIRELKTDGKSQLRAIDSRLEACERGILQISDLVQQIYG